MSLKSILLTASKIARMTTHHAVHRHTLFFVANFQLGSRSAIEDFQRCIETGVEEGVWTQEERGSGNYLHTTLGQKTIDAIPDESLRTWEALAGECKFELEGQVAGSPVKLRRDGRKFEVTIENRKFDNAADGIRQLASIDRSIQVKDATSRSQAGALYNLAVKRGFIGRWVGANG